MSDSCPLGTSTLLVIRGCVNDRVPVPELAVKKAIEIGRLLTEQKAELAHGEWIPWVESNLTFNDSQARKYMRVYRNRHRSTDLLDGATSINQAVALLAEPKDPPAEDQGDGPDIDPDMFREADESAPEPEPKIVYQPDPEQTERQNYGESPL